MNYGPLNDLHGEVREEASQSNINYFYRYTILVPWDVHRQKKVVGSTREILQHRDTRGKNDLLRIYHLFFLLPGLILSPESREISRHISQFFCENSGLRFPWDLLHAIRLNVITIFSAHKYSWKIQGDCRDIPCRTLFHQSHPLEQQQWSKSTLVIPFLVTVSIPYIGIYFFIFLLQMIFFCKAL